MFLYFCVISIYSSYFSEKNRSFWFHLYDSDRIRYQKVEINGVQLTVDTPGVDCHISTKVISFFVFHLFSFFNVENDSFQGQGSTSSKHISESRF